MTRRPGRIRAAFFAAAAVALLAAGAPARQSPTPRASAPQGQNQQPKVTFQATTQLVQVPVTVLDSRGQFISGLQAGDFRLYVDGKPTPIVALDVTRNLAPTVMPPPTVAGAITNLQELGARNRLVFLFDFIHSSSTELARLRPQLIQFFSQPLPPGVDAAIFSLRPDLRVEQPFTRESALLIAAIRRLSGLPAEGQIAPSMGSVAPPPSDTGDSGAPAQPGGGGGPMAQAAAAAEANILAVHNEMDAGFRRADYYQTMDPLQLLAKMLAAIPGHKELLWVTPATSFVILPDQSTGLNGTRMWKAMQLMNAANTSLFQIDPRGLNASTGPGYMRGLMINDEVAKVTGGAALGLNNNLAGLVRTAAARIEDQYILYFAPATAPGPQERYRNIKVEVKRPGARISYRRGFLQAALNFKPKSDQPLNFRDLAMSPLDWGEIPLTLAAGQPGPERAAYWKGARKGEMIQQTPFTLKIPASELLHARPDGTWAFDFTVAAIMVSMKTGVAENMPPDHFQRTLSAAAEEVMRAQNIRYRGFFVLAPGEQAIGRVAVRDNITGAVGTVTTFLPAPASADGE